MKWTEFCIKQINKAINTNAISEKSIKKYPSIIILSVLPAHRKHHIFIIIFNSISAMSFFSLLGILFFISSRVGSRGMCVCVGGGGGECLGCFNNSEKRGFKKNKFSVFRIHVYYFLWNVRKKYNACSRLVLVHI